jgi:hypothetical protein
MKASESLQNDQSTATENALRLAVDTTPAFIRTSPRGYERLAHLTKQLQGTLHSRLIDLHTIFTFALCLWRDW